MADWCRRFDRIESFFVYGRFHLLGPKYTEAISYNLREVILLLNFCYFFSFIFYPDSIASGGRVYRQDRATGVRIGYRTYLLVRYLLDLFECGRCSGNLPHWSITGVLSSCFRFGGFCAPILKLYRRKGYNFKKVVIVGAGKNGMELHQVMKDDLSYGFSVKGFLMTMTR